MKSPVAASRILILLFCCIVAGAQPSSWSLARNAHFEIYSQAGGKSAREALAWFERLQAFFIAEGLANAASARPPVRVIGFESESEYRAFRLRPTADAFYIGDEGRDYIVMPSLAHDQFGLAAHEFTHLVLRNSKLDLPLWLSEGLAEFFSTVRITNRGCELGGELPMRLQTLRDTRLVPLATLFAIDRATFARETRDQLAIFYAESWALTDLLVLSTSYGAHFDQLIKLLNTGTPSAEALPAVYSQSLTAVEEALRNRIILHRFAPLALAPVTSPSADEQLESLSTAQADFLLADLLAASGASDRANAMFRSLSQSAPTNPAVFAALGVVALQRGAREEATQFWRMAIDNGVRDASLCYRYSVLASERELPQAEIRRALIRALELKPDFDDARYSLAILESNAGEYAEAVKDLHAMGTPAAQRAFGYWSTLAYALTELDLRSEAKEAASRALLHATTPSERAHALGLAYIADTDLTVQFVRDADGQSHLATTRVPHGKTGFNPFIEPQDKIVREEGTLHEVECGGGHLTGFVVNTPGGPLKLAVLDPMRVQMRNSPAEFTCGLQPAKPVRVEFAAAQDTSQKAVLRGMEFR